MAARPTYLPKPFVGAFPMRLEKFEQYEQEAPNCRIRLQTGSARQMQGIHDLAIDIELELSGCGIDDVHRRSALVSGKPGNFILIEAPHAGHPVEDLQI